MTQENNCQDPPPLPPETQPTEEPSAENIPDGLNTEQRRSGSIDALAAMASGQDVTPVDPAFSVGNEPATETPPATGTAGAPPAPPAAPTDPFAAAGASSPNPVSRQQSLQARQKRAAALAGQSQHAHAQQLKSFMIPMLIVTGSLLFVLATVVALFLNNTTGYFDPVRSPWYHNPTTKKVLVLVAYPMGAILFLGAYLFYTDLQRQKNKKNAKKE